MNRGITFTHVWVTNFGWENSVFLQTDFDYVEELGYNDIDGYIFVAYIDKYMNIFKGKYKNY